MARKKLSASEIFAACGINPVHDFFALSYSQAEQLAGYAKSQGYRKPRNANGSLGRCFHAKLQRELARETKA